MTFKKGDRVRVEYEAVVVNPSDCDGDVEMRVEGSPQPRWAKPEEVTAIEPQPPEPTIVIKVEGLLTEDLTKAIDRAIASYVRRHGRSLPR